MRSVSCNTFSSLSYAEASFEKPFNWTERREDTWRVVSSWVCPAVCTSARCRTWPSRLACSSKHFRPSAPQSWKSPPWKIRTSSVLAHETLSCWTIIAKNHCVLREVWACPTVPGSQQARLSCSLRNFRPSVPWCCGHLVTSSAHKAMLRLAYPRSTLMSDSGLVVKSLCLSNRSRYNNCSCTFQSSLFVLFWDIAGSWSRDVGVFNDFSNSTGYVPREKTISHSKVPGAKAKNPEGTCLLRCITTCLTSPLALVHWLLGTWPCAPSIYQAGPLCAACCYNTTGDFEVADFEKMNSRRAPWHTKTSVALTSGVTTTWLVIEISSLEFTCLCLTGRAFLSHFRLTCALLARESSRSMVLGRCVPWMLPVMPFTTRCWTGIPCVLPWWERGVHRLHKHREYVRFWRE